MNTNTKSTPLAQLPAFTAPNGSGGQQALPVEDDAVIEALSYMQGTLPSGPPPRPPASAPSQATQQMSPQVTEMMFQQQQQQQQEQQQQIAYMQQQQQLAMMQKQAQMQHAQAQMQQAQQAQLAPPQALQQAPVQQPKTLLSIPDFDELRLMLIVVSAAISLALLPISEVASRFLPLDRIPYGEAIVRALLLGVAVFVSRRALEHLA